MYTVMYRLAAYLQLSLSIGLIQDLPYRGYFLKFPFEENALHAKTKNIQAPWNDISDSRFTFFNEEPFIQVSTCLFQHEWLRKKLFSHT